MSDAAETVREALFRIDGHFRGPNYNIVGQAFAALASLLAERDEARRERDEALLPSVEDVQTIYSLAAANQNLADAEHQIINLRQDSAAAEAEVARLRGALRRIADPESEWANHKAAVESGRVFGALPYEIARAALSGGSDE